MTDRAALLDELLRDPLQAATVPREEALALLVALAPVERALELLTLPSPTLTAPAPRESVQTRLLTVAEVAQRSRMSVRWIRDNWRKRLPFGFKKGRSVLFPAKEVEKWLNKP